MKSKSIHGASAPEIKEALHRAMDDGFRPTVAIIFSSVQQDRDAICMLFRTHTIDVFGATSCGEFIDGTQTKGAIAILLLEIPKEQYTILLQPIENATIETGASGLAKQALNAFANPSLIVCCTGMDKNGAFFNVDSISDT